MSVFTTEDAAYVARRLEDLPAVKVDLFDYGNALRATFQPYMNQRFVVFWGAELSDSMPSGFRPAAAEFHNYESFLNFVAAELLSRGMRAWIGSRGVRLFGTHE